MSTDDFDDDYSEYDSESNEVKKNLAHDLLVAAKVNKEVETQSYLIVTLMKSEDSDALLTYYTYDSIPGASYLSLLQIIDSLLMTLKLKVAKSLENPISEYEVAVESDSVSDVNKDNTKDTNKDIKKDNNIIDLNKIHRTDKDRLN